MRHELTVKEQIDAELRRVTDRRDSIILSVNERGFGHIRSYVLHGLYRGASVQIDKDQLEDWVLVLSASRIDLVKNLQRGREID